jgi:hypothetical protein
VSILVANVWCAECVAEGRRTQGKLGTVERNDHGDLVWIGYVSATIWPPRLGRRSGVDLREPRVLASLSIEHVPLPERMPAYCRRGHGWGGVAARELLTARGNVIAKLE